MKKLCTRLAHVAGLCCGLALTAAVQAGPTPIMTVLYQDFDWIEGVGLVTNFNNMAINSNGSWVVEIVTDGLADSNVVVVRDGVILIQENDAIDPAGANISSFDSINLNLHGNRGWNMFLRNLPTNQDTGVYFNSTLLIQENQISNAAGFSADTPYIGFFDTKINGSNNILVLASVDDPLIASTVDRAIVVLTVNPDGTLASETVIAKEGDILPGQTEAVADFATGPHGTAFNDDGDIMFVADLTGNTALDGVVYINNTVVAQEGAPGPILGRSWRTLSSTTKVGLNNHGHYVHTGTLDGDAATDLVIVENGRVFVQEGDVLPSIAPFAITSFGSGPVHISDRGDILWYGVWNNPDSTVNHGLFLNHDLLIQRGVTTVNGLPVTTVRGIEDGYHISPNGRYILARVVLGTNIDAMIHIDLGEAPPECPADWNGDEVVNSQDISAFITDWLSSVNLGSLDADFNSDGVVNSTDISAFITAWLDAVTNGC